MRRYVLVLLLLMSLPASLQEAAAGQMVSSAPLIKTITIKGFVLGDKSQFFKLFRPYRNKHLSSADIEALLGQIQGIYEHAGYQGLVLIGHQIQKRSLTFTVSLIK